MTLWAFNPKKPWNRSVLRRHSWRRIHATDPFVSEFNLELKLSTKDPLALASMKNVAKREM